MTNSINKPTKGGWIVKMQNKMWQNQIKVNTITKTNEYNIIIIDYLKSIFIYFE